MFFFADFGDDGLESADLAFADAIKCDGTGGAGRASDDGNGCDESDNHCHDDDFFAERKLLCGGVFL